MFESTSICLSLTQQLYCLRDSERQLGMQVHTAKNKFLVVRKYYLF